ncbi:MAG TPA: pyruvate ferredoxin oxidoreductase, partial [Bacillota bacterium]|nr:pyruvate ferredoxin oxidoreductase [Bacillota bacterium]
KAESFSACGGPLFAEVRSALYDCGTRPLMVNYIYGLGGRDVMVENILYVFESLKEIAAAGKAGETYRYLGVRE